MANRMTDLRMRFGLILAVALLPLLIFSVGQALDDYRTDRMQARAITQAQARLSVQRLLGAVDDGLAALNFLSETVADLDCETDFQTVIETSEEIDNLILADRSGKFVCMDRPISSVLQAFDIAKTLTPGEPVHLEVRRSQPGARRQFPPVLVLAKGDYDANGLQRIFLAGINLSRMGTLMNAENMARDIDIAVLSREGDRLFVSNPAFPPVAPQRLAQLNAVGARTSRFQARAMGEVAARREVTIMPTRESDLFVAISEPHVNLLSWQRLNPLASGLVPLIAWIFAFGAIWFAVERMILVHVRTLRAAAGSLADGRMETRVGEMPDAPEKLAALGEALDSMANTVTEREEALRENLAEKEILLREIHHRVKNNLQIIISLLNMSKRSQSDPEALRVLEETHNRVNAIALVHRTVYDTDELATVDMPDYLSQLCRDISMALDAPSRGIRILTNVAAVAIDPDLVIPISLFVVEALTNSIYHGVPDGGTIRVELSGELEGEGDDTTFCGCMSITDSGNGAGGPNGEFEHATGFKLMRGFARQLRAKLIEDQTSEGFRLALEFDALPAIAARHAQTPLKISDIIDGTEIAT